jgi:hypothetical protein
MGCKFCIVDFGYWINDLRDLGRTMPAAWAANFASSILGAGSTTSVIWDAPGCRPTNKSAEFVYELGEPRRINDLPPPASFGDAWQRMAICVHRHQTIDRPGANGGFFRGSARRKATGAENLAGNRFGGACLWEILLFQPLAARLTMTFLRHGQSVPSAFSVRSMAACTGHLPQALRE